MEICEPEPLAEVRALAADLEEQPLLDVVPLKPGVESERGRLVVRVD